MGGAGTGVPKIVSPPLARLQSLPIGGPPTPKLFQLNSTHFKPNQTISNKFKPFQNNSNNLEPTQTMSTQFNPFQTPPSKSSVIPIALTIRPITVHPFSRLSLLHLPFRHVRRRHNPIQIPRLHGQTPQPLPFHTTHPLFIQQPWILRVHR